MLPKPVACKNCPLYDDGMGFVPDELVPNSRVFVMLQNPGADEEAGHNGLFRPAIGQTGRKLDSDFLPLAGLTRGVDVSVGNVIKCRYRSPKTGTKTNDLPSKFKQAKLEKEAAEYCLSHHTFIPDNTQLIVANGDLAWSSLGQPGKLEGWRGFIGPHTWRNLPVFGTFHPSYLNYQPRMNIPVMLDWKRVGAILHGEWPEPLPVVPAHAPDYDWVSIDTEYSPETYEIYLIGIAFWTNGRREPKAGVQFRSHTWHFETLQQHLKHIIGNVPVVAHNALAELLSLNATFGFEWSDYYRIEDTIQMHALLQSEWPHDLGFIESIHGRHNRMKHLRKNEHKPYTAPWWAQQELYNWGDVLTCGYAYQDLRQQLERDTQSRHVYNTQNVPLIHIRYKAKKAGVWLDRSVLSQLSEDLAGRVNYAVSAAHAYSGFPINIGSEKQLQTWLQHVEGIKLKKKKGSDNYTLDKDAIANLRRLYYDFDPDNERDGITPESFNRAVGEGGHPLLEARAMYQSADTLYTHFVAPFISPQYITVPGACGRPKDHFLEWVSADQSTHSQASGRWSVQNPPLTTIPAKLRKIIIPPPGCVLVKYDADQQELRLNAHLAGDEPTLEAFRQGWDIHTLNTCDIFNLPYPPNLKDPHHGEDNAHWRNTVKWEGKDDKRRVFSKRFVYRLIYRGDPAQAGDIPGAKALGLSKEGLVSASKNYLRAHPALVGYWRRLDDTIRRTRIVRSFEGRKRFLNGDIKALKGAVPAICREGTNHPIQSGGVDWSNTLILSIDRACTDLSVTFLYGSFDSHVWQVPEAFEVPFRERVMEITARPWHIDGRPLDLPITLDPTIYPPA